MSGYKYPGKNSRVSIYGLKKVKAKAEGTSSTAYQREYRHEPNKPLRAYCRMILAEEIPEPGVPFGEETVDLKECLLRLDERERIPILLYYLEGFDIGQIAKVLRIPQGTVKSRLHRGREQLRTICREEVFE